MKKIRIAVVGFGNIGPAVVDAALAAPDMEIAGVVLRDRTKAAEKGVVGLPVAEDISELGAVDVVMLCTPSPDMPDLAAKFLHLGINTVDSYDIHSDLYDMQCKIAEGARSGSAVAVIGAGWDPGTDSMVRGILEAAAPRGMTHTNFGPGMSMGHTSAVKAIPGVRKALSMTIPLGSGIHRRMVYVEVLDGFDFETVRESIKNDPYFIKDETHVFLVDDIDALQDRGHGVNMIRRGVSGQTDNQFFEFNMRINNPALTAQVMVAAGRATIRLRERKIFGCYTMLEIPIIDLLPGDREGIIRRLV